MLPELLAEFFGTMILLLFGNGVVAMVVLFGHPNIPGEIVNGGFTNINFAFGIGVTMGVYVAARISGGHLNPAVTLAVAAFRKFPWSKVIPYCIAQTAGAFVGAAIVYWNYSAQFHMVDPNLDHTAGVFATFPAFPSSLSIGFLDQTIGTAILVFLIFALIDDRNTPPQANLTPVLVGLIVVGIGMSFGALHGYAINPARDFGPRLFSVLAGFKNNGLTDGGNIFWVPIVAPLLGGLIGGAAYDFGIHRFLPEPAASKSKAA
jgi:glycerol uptake facilitator protein